MANQRALAQSPEIVSHLWTKFIDTIVRKESRGQRQSGFPAVPRVRQLSLSKLVDRQNFSVSGIGELGVFAADCSQSLYQGEDQLKFFDGPRLLEAGDERVDALKDRIFLSGELQHPRSSLPC